MYYCLLKLRWKNHRFRKPPPRPPTHTTTPLPPPPPMAISGEDRYAAAGGGGDSGGGKLWNLCRMPFWQPGGAPATASAPPPPSSSSSSAGIHHHSAGRYGHEGGGGGAVAGDGAPAGSISSVAKSLLPARRRLRLDPPNKLYFPCECARGIRGLGSSASWFNCGMRSWGEWGAAIFAWVC